MTITMGIVRVALWVSRTAAGDPTAITAGFKDHQLVGERRQCRDVSVGVAEGEGDVGALHIPEVPHPAAKGPHYMYVRGG